MDWLVIAAGLLVLVLPLRGIRSAGKRKRDGLYSRRSLILSLIWAGWVLLADVVMVVRGQGITIVSVVLTAIAAWWVWACVDANRAAGQLVAAPHAPSA